MDAFLNKIQVEDGPTIDLNALLNGGSKEEEYGTWLNVGGEYTPTSNVKASKHIPAGSYKIAWKDNDYRLIPLGDNHDELYQFKEDLSKVILEECDKFWNRADIYKQYKMTHKRGLLLTGKPGTGKTCIINLLIDQIVKQDGIVLYITNAKEFSLYLDILKPAIRKLEKERKIITVIEDIDQLIEGFGECDSAILDLLDGKHTIDHHLVIMTSNNTSNLSEALLRPSRIDMIFEVPVPSEETRREYFTKKGIEGEELEAYVSQTEDLSFAELKEVFIGTKVLGKELSDVVNNVKNPLELKDYLHNSTQMGI